MKPTSTKTTRRGSGGRGADAYNHYEAIFPGGKDERPTDDDVAAAQEAHGFHPAGYGSPMRITREELPDVVGWRVRWQSFASCD